MYSDVAMLLSKCEDVYSADVPAALQELAKVIADSGKGNEFATMSAEVKIAICVLFSSRTVFTTFVRCSVC